MVTSCTIKGIRYEIIFNRNQTEEGWHYRGTLHTEPELVFWCSLLANGVIKFTPPSGNADARNSITIALRDYQVKNTDA